MPLRDLLKKRDKVREDVPGIQDPPRAQSPTEFTFMRSDTNTQELIQPPTFGDEGDVPTPAHEHHTSKLVSRFRSSSNASITSSGSSKGEKRLSQRLHLRSASRASSISAIVPADLPAIDDAADGSEEKEARWEERATILAQGSHTMSQDSAVKKAKGSLHSGGNSKPTMTRSISDAKGDVMIGKIAGQAYQANTRDRRQSRKRSGFMRQEVSKLLETTTLVAMQKDKIRNGKLTLFAMSRSRAIDRDVWALGRQQRHGANSLWARSKVCHIAWKPLQKSKYQLTRHVPDMAGAPPPTQVWD